jgi:TPR repeat protein/S1-C subfamily serine protease
MLCGRFAIIAISCTFFLEYGCTAPSTVPPASAVGTPTSSEEPASPATPAPPTLETQLTHHMQAAVAGNLDALLAAADIYRDVSFAQHDLRRSDELIVQAALAGSAEAMFRAGELYATPLDASVEEEAVRWYSLAAGAGHAAAARELGRGRTFGRTFANRLGTQKNDVEALKKAADSGDALAQLLLDSFYKEGTGTDVEAFTWMKKAADSGDAYAQLLLASFYKDGTGTAANEEEAALWAETGLAALTLLAEQGNSDAQYNLGKAYLGGTGVEPNRDQGIAWYRKAAEGGNAKAQFELGSLEEDAKQRLEWYRKAAEQGNPSMQSFVGDVLMKEDATQAVEWYRIAAERGYSLAQYNLGEAYADGNGVPQDFKQAVEWWRKAAEQGTTEPGNAYSIYRLGWAYSYGKGVEKDAKQAVEWYRKVADRGFSGGQVRLGDAYRIGEGVEKDEKQAVEWYRKAAEQGEAVAQVLLGTMYANGDGVEKDPKQAVEFFRKAAEQEDTEAQHSLGRAYFRGEGVKKDAKQGVEWYRKAAEQGDANAQCDLGGCYERGEGVKKDVKQAVEWYQKAAEQGNANAQNNLAFCYLSGYGVIKDAKHAVEWYRRAAEQGFASAQYNLGASYKSGEGVVQDYVEAYKWFNLAASQLDFLSEDRESLARLMTAEQIAEAQRRAAAFVPKTWQQIKSEESGTSTVPAPTVGSESDKSTPKGNATAFLVTSDGYAVTSAHVADAAAQRIDLYHKEQAYPAKVVIVDRANDIAVLKVTGDFPAVAVRSSAGVALGAEVCTVGFPNIALQGVAPKATRGNINSLSGLQDDPRYFQISAEINPGNSGGALIDMTGSVVGVVSLMLDSKISASVTGALPQNVNYAVKSAYLLPLLEGVDGFSDSLKKTQTSAAASPEEAIAKLEKATCLVLVY